MSTETLTTTGPPDAESVPDYAGLCPKLPDPRSVTVWKSAKTLNGFTEGIEPLFQREYLRRSQASAKMYDEARDKAWEDAMRDFHLDQLAKQIGSVATGLDYPMSRRKKLIRSIDETWEGG